MACAFGNILGGERCDRSFVRGESFKSRAPVLRFRLLFLACSLVSGNGELGGLGLESPVFVEDMVKCLVQFVHFSTQRMATERVP